MEYVRKHLNEIVEKAKRGDEEAFEQLMGLVETRAKYIVRGKLDEKYVDDVLQEARISAFKGLKNLQDNMKFESWFFKILYYKTIDAINEKCNNKESTSLDQMEEEMGDKCCQIFLDDSSKWDPEVNAHKKEIREGLLKLISELPEKQRIAIVEYYHDGKTVREIAEKYHVAIGTAKSWLSSGRKKILHAIEDLRSKNASFFCQVLLMMKKINMCNKNFA